MTGQEKEWFFPSHKSEYFYRDPEGKICFRARPKYRHWINLLIVGGEALFRFGPPPDVVPNRVRSAASKAGKKYGKKFVVHKTPEGMLVTRVA